MDSLPAGTVFGLITAICTSLTALGGLIVTLKVFIPAKRTSEEAKVIAKETHVIVNQQRTDMIRYTTVLTRALERAGIDIPEDQSKLD